MASVRHPRAVLSAALALGLAGDHLFRATQWGLNLALWVGFLSLEFLLFRLRLTEETRTASPVPVWPWVAATLLAVMGVVRDAEFLLAFDLMAIVMLLSLPVLTAHGVSLPRSGAMVMATAPLRAGSVALADGLRVISSWWPAVTGQSPVVSTGLKVGLGLALAVVPLLVFGGLFGSADPLFLKNLTWLIRIDLEPVFSHLIVVGVLTWGSAGFLWGLLHPAPRWPIALPRLSLGPIPVATLLGAVALMFAGFVATQAGSLFGGEAFVMAQSGLTYAEYARQGFAQMALASALALPLVYWARWAVGPEAPNSRPLALLVGLQLLLTGLVLASAFWRMGLYIRVYGLTEDRLYGSVFMLWIAATIGIFARTVVKGRLRGAAYGSLIAGVVCLLTLNLANPEAMIARHNLNAADSRPLDIPHLVRLGGDAVPVIVARLERLSLAQRCEVTWRLIERHQGRQRDWRGWNLSRARAIRMVGSLAPIADSCTRSGFPERPQTES